MRKPIVLVSASPSFYPKKELSKHPVLAMVELEKKYQHKKSTIIKLRSEDKLKVKMRGKQLLLTVLGFAALSGIDANLMMCMATDGYALIDIRTFSGLLKATRDGNPIV